MKNLFEPVAIGSVTVPNRIVFAPTSMGREAVEKYRQLAQSGVGMIVLPDVSVVPSMLGAPSLDSMAHGDFFRAVGEACHPFGCKVAVQLFHPEYDVEAITNLYRQRDKLSREDINRQLAESMNTYCDTLTTEEIQAIVVLFVKAAINAAQLGMDLIQIHGDRLLGSFSSALFNHRTDRYGDRLQFPVEVVQAVRAAVPQLAIDFKLTVRTETPQLGRGGVLLEEVGNFVPALEKAGVDSFHVALANHSNIRDTIPAANHPDLQGEGCFLHLAREVKRHATKPVCAVGKLQHPDFVQGVVEEGFALVGLSRQLIADPLWVAKVREGRTDEIRYCAYCNARCVASIMTGQSVGCIFDERK